MKRKNGFVELILYVVAFAGAAIMLMPFVWMVDTSLKLPEEVQVWPPTWTTVNALFTRPIKTSIDHSAYASVNYGAMSLQQMLSSGVGGREKELPDVLTLKLVGTPPIRGIFNLRLSESNGQVKYATSVNRTRLVSLIRKIDSTKYPISFKDKLKNLEVLKSKPVEYIKAFINLFKYSKSPVLSRINFISGLTESAKFSDSFFKRYGPILARNPRLLASKGDSSSVLSQKKFLKHFLLSDVYTKASNAFVKRIQRFKKGLGTLAPDSKNLYSEIESFINKVDLERILKEKFGGISPSLSFIINFYEMRAIEPVKEWMNLLRSYDEMQQFYISSKKVVLKNPEIRFGFFTQREKIQNLKNAILNSKIPKYYSTLALGIIRKQKLGNFVNLLIKRIGSMEKSSVLKLGVSKDETVLLLGKLSNIVANMKILYTSLTSEEQSDLNEMISKDSNNMEVFSHDIVSTFGKLHPNMTSIISGQLEQYANLVSSYGEKASKLEGFLSTLWDDQRAVTKLTGIFNNVYYTMKVLKAPSIVSKVQYFPQNGKIKVFLKGINSVWFSDAKVTTKVKFNFQQVLANLFQNYVEAWNAAPFARYYLNTVFVATVTTFLSIVFGVMAAFAFSKLHFKGRDFFFMLFLSTMMIPGEVLLVPNFITIVKFGWLNTYYALIVPWIASAFVIFLIRQNFMSVPDELFDAAKIDGASSWRFLWTVMVPLSKPVIITGALLNFVGSWNAFLWVLIVTNTPSMRTLPVGLQNFSSNAGTLYNQLMAASTFSMLPIVILFLFAQKYFIQGIARSGLK